jgi:hypothetical protein
MLRAACLLLALAVTAVTGSAQARSQRDGDCRDRWFTDRDRAVHCETREETFSGSGLLDVDASRNGGIRVRGWNRSEIRLVSHITAYGSSEARARSLASEVRIETGGTIRATGPAAGRDEHWSVSYEIDVPRDGRLALATNNGGITIEDFRGSANFTARNGGVTLTEVREGPGLNVETRNGGIRLALPDRYSAELQTSTVNGRVRIDFPVTVQGEIGRDIRASLGSGGARVRAVTRNGGVTISRR